MRRVAPLLVIAWLILGPPGSTGRAQPGPGLRTEGTELVLSLPDGRVLRSAQLVGAELELPADDDGARRIRVESVHEDAEARGGSVWLHHFTLLAADGSRSELCDPDPDGRRLGFPVPAADGLELVCTSGAVAKCVRWGYRFWEEQPGGAPLRALHRACVQMTRADYGGDGQTATRDGTLVELYDRFGVRPAPDLATLDFEAAWNAEGALCVARPRIPELVTLAELGQRHPELRGRLGSEACSRETAWDDPRALLFNHSPAPASQSQRSKAGRSE